MRRLLVSSRQSFSTLSALSRSCTTNTAYVSPSVFREEHEAAAKKDKLVLVEETVLDGVCTLSLNNPPINILTPPLLDELNRTILMLCSTGAESETRTKSTASAGSVPNGYPLSQPCRGIVLTSAFSSVFSAGLDLNILAAVDEGEPQQQQNQRGDGKVSPSKEFVSYWNAFQHLFLLLHGLPVPIVAAINGHAPAAGCILALATDYRVMSRVCKSGNSNKDSTKEAETTRIGITAAKAGFAAPPFVAASLVHVVGHRNAELLLQLGTQLSAADALKIGLVDEVTEAADEANVAALCEIERYLAMPHPHTRWLVKDHMRRSILQSLSTKEARVQDCVSFFEMLSAPSVKAVLGAAMRKQK